MSASGGFAGTLVFGTWKGRATVRQLVTPANPQSADQQSARNIVRAAGAAQRFANLCVLKGAARAVTDKAALIAACPAGQAWNGYLVKSITGINAANYAAATAAYAALTAPNRAAWDGAAAGMVPAIMATAQKGVGGAPATNLTAGETMFHYQYGLFMAGVCAAPGAVPPSYAA
jgi:hypothetical protein